MPAAGYREAARAIKLLRGVAEDDEFLETLIGAQMEVHRRRSRRLEEEEGLSDDDRWGAHNT